jgi:hypothetical protein
MDTTNIEYTGNLVGDKPITDIFKTFPGLKEVIR